MNLPKTISPCPIVESTLEIRLQTNLPPDAIVGLVYSNFFTKDNTIQLDVLPISQIPLEIRRQDANLKYKPTHRIRLKEYHALIGPNVVILTIPGKYIGWDRFKDCILDFIQTIQSNIISKIEYIGLRYLNFFEYNIFEKIKLKIGNDEFKPGFPTIFKSEYREQDYNNVLQITNGIHLQNPQLNINADGSLIDITTVLINVDYNSLLSKIEVAHLGAKTVFFSLLSNDLIKALNPKYE